MKKAAAIEKRQNIVRQHRTVRHRFLKTVLLPLVSLMLLMTGCRGNSDVGQSFSQSEQETARAEATAIATQLIRSAFTDDILTRNTISDEEIFRFLISIPHYRDTANPYRNIGMTGPTLYAYPLTEVKEMAYRLFGRTDWFYEDESYNPRWDEYELRRSSGLPGSSFLDSDMTAIVSPSGTVTVTCTLRTTDYAASPDTALGQYELSFVLLREDDTVFLRFLAIVPVTDA